MDAGVAWGWGASTVIDEERGLIGQMPHLDPQFYPVLSSSVILLPLLLICPVFSLSVCLLQCGLTFDCHLLINMNGYHGLQAFGTIAAPPNPPTRRRQKELQIHVQKCHSQI